MSKYESFLETNLKATVPVPAFRISSTAILELLLGERRGAVGKGNPEQSDCEQGQEQGSEQARQGGGNVQR